MDDSFASGFLAGQDSGGGNGGGGFWGDGLWAIIILAMLGFGRGGFGGGGNMMGGDGISAGFAWQGIDNGIRGIQQGICDSTYALNNTIVNGFHGVDNAICNLGYQMKDCCCETQRLIERGFCDTNQAINNSTREILGFLTKEKIESLRDENQTLRFAASQANQNAFITANQEAQTAELIRRLGRDNPVPAYVVPNPNCCYGNPLGVGYAGWGNNYNGNGCGCGCG